MERRTSASYTFRKPTTLLLLQGFGIGVDLLDE
jgi:hypothetical protein